MGAESAPAPSKSGQKMVKGSCLCKQVLFEADGPPQSMTACHCEACRKISGNPFMVFGLWTNDSIRWKNGSSTSSSSSSSSAAAAAPPAFKNIELSDMAVRGSCAECHTPLYMNYHCSADKTNVLLGIIDPTDAAGFPRFVEHCFLKEGVPWWPVPESDQVALFQEFPDDYHDMLNAWEEKGKPRRTAL